MKRTLITLALVAAAGTAGAQTVTPPSVGGATVTPPSVGGASLDPVSQPAVGHAGLQSAQRLDPGVNPPSVGAPEHGQPAGDAERPRLGTAQAKIKADGYTNVQGLNRNPDGKLERQGDARQRHGRCRRRRPRQRLGEVSLA